MSARKNKSDGTPLDPQAIFDRIADHLIAVKEILGTKGADPLKSLGHIASLAASFTRAKQKSKKINITALADSLDREGVSLWNVSTFIRDDPEKCVLVAALRLAGFRLIEAGLEPKPSVETLVHILQIASKAGSALSASGSNQVATEVLACAAAFEETLRNAHDPNNAQNSATKASAVITYYSGRMEGAWKDGNESVAFFMLQQATDPQRLNLLSLFDREHLATRVLEIGKAILKTSLSALNEDDKSRLTSTNVFGGNNPAMKNAILAVKWLQRAFHIIETATTNGGLSDTGNIVGGSNVAGNTSDLRRAILKSLARAYFASSSEPDNLARAEATLNEIIEDFDSIDDDRKVTENFAQEALSLRWMKLAVLNKRKANSSELNEALSAIIERMLFEEGQVTDALQELRNLIEDHRVLVTELSLKLLSTALVAKANTGYPFVERILLSLIFHCKGDLERHNDSLRAITSACVSIAAAPEFMLDKVPTVACQTLLWQIGDRLYASKKWVQAAEWYMISAHTAFEIMAPSTVSKCFRKAALCHIQHGDYTKAAEIISRCAGNEAGSHYVVFLTAAHQGLEGGATAALHNMIKAPDFDRKMLLLATQLAHERAMKPLLLTILGALLQTLQSESGLTNEVEGVTLVRCMVRVVLDLLKEPAADIPSLLDALIRHFRTAKDLITTALRKKESAMITKDISWLWRTSYNAAIQGCSEWSGKVVSNLFDVSGELMEQYRKASVGNPDPGISLYMILASFSSISARVFDHRQAPSDDNNEATRRNIITDIKSLLKFIKDNGAKDDDRKKRLTTVIHFLVIFEAEQMCTLGAWEELIGVIQEIGQSDVELSVDTFEAIADALWVQPNCPSHVLFTALEAILHSGLNRNAFVVDKFSRWLRAICTILLARNGPSDRVKALGYVEQAIDVIKDHSDDGDDQGEVYPSDERQWLLTVSYNTGVECFGASHLDEAKRWFESATQLSTYVPDGVSIGEKVAETYKNLLERFGSS